jgi:hypothetical protein
MIHRAQKFFPVRRDTLPWMCLGAILATFDASALGQDANAPQEEPTKSIEATLIRNIPGRRWNA